jgi:CYTH domain-containing protein/predicted ATPase
MNNIPVFVLGGGPCGGKTDALVYLRSVLEGLGYAVFVSPEAATDLILRGIVPGKTISNELFQELVFAKTLESEAACHRAAEALGDKKCIILCDRGVRDSLAYTSEEHFAELAKKFGTHPDILRDHRADAVFHLRTAALGAERFFTCANNVARRESLEEARLQDERSLNAWVGHPHLRVIPNMASRTFEDKLEHLSREVLHFLNAVEIERKFLVEFSDLRGLEDYQSNPYYARVPIIQHYLKAEKGSTRRVRARGEGDACLYTETVKSRGGELSCSERERVITKDEHHHLIMTALDHGRQPIKKYRSCFVFKDQYFELDVFRRPLIPYAMLERELLSEKEEVVLPPFLKVVKEVSDDPAWKNSAIARRVPVLA